MTYIPFIFVKPIFSLPSATVEKDCLANILAIFGLLGAFLHEAAEGRDTSARTDHDDGFAWVGGEFEVGVADMDRNVEAVVFIAGTIDGVGEAVGRWFGVTVLLLFEGEEVVRGNAFDNVAGAGDAY